ncbi:Macrolide export ATP-binding/permease protein MacB [Luteitalea pratensis]|uniref:Macrolide export ATP-binding/permease protein MacB n=1 Tax=Luteitalea pratensis TaxID=1855912 RepID=A0A143PJ91_LUTPR|nr:FtsX-like permease family protein [Luteitalea pratensis]AMY08476.1 Macrolide export ATP-binding/permease protein MacB [Luteitalea pratensis]
MHKPRPFWHLRRSSIPSEVDEELQLHFDMRVAELVGEGMPADQARRTALRQFGDLEATRRYCRQQDERLENVTQRGLFLQDVLQDLRIGTRGLLRAPALVLTIVASVGLGLGATAAIFGAVNAALLRPLPYAEPDRLVRIDTDTPPFKFRFSAVDYLAFSEQQTRFERSATYTDRSVSFLDGDTAELLRTRVVSWGFFSVVARATSRHADLAVRTALGTSRGRLLRYLLAESAVLAAGAAALGLGVAWVGLRLLQTQASGYFPRMAEIRFDTATVLFVAALAISSALLFGLLPALQATRGSANVSVRSTRTITGGMGARRLRRSLVTAQFAIATPLLVVAALLLTNINRLRDVDLGFDTTRVLTGSIRLPTTQYREGAHAQVFWDELRRRVETLPGVSSVAFADGLPPNNVGNFNNFDLEQHPTPSGQSQPVTPWVAVTADYVRTLGLTLLEGRLLDERDAAQDDLLSIVVDRAWARRFFPNESAVGQRLREGGCTTCPWTTVVGVVSQVKYAGIDRPDEGTVYTPLAGGTSRYVVVRTAGDPRTIAAPVRQVVRQLEPSAPLSDVATMDMLVDQSLEQPQSLSLLVTGFATIALLLSAIGVNGAMGYYVQQHLKEICIRMALGGSRADVARLVIGHGMAVAGMGIVAGLVLALMTTHLMSSLLFGVGTLDLSAYTTAGALLLVVALVACAVPAFRAMRLQPATVLRGD